MANTQTTPASTGYAVSEATAVYMDALQALQQIKKRLPEALKQTYGEDWQKRFNCLDFTDIEDYLREFLFDNVGNNVNNLNTEL